MARGRTGAASTGRLPVHLTPFLGREEELAELRELVEQEALITLVGPPGGGKTRLGIKLAAELEPRYPASVCFVDLTATTEVAQIATAIAHALDLREERGREMLDTVCGALADGPPVLVILDNCEHTVAAAAEVAERLLRSCPQLRLLATSRRPLGMAGERVWKLSPLDLGSATELFVDRARRASRDLDFDAGGMALVRTICERLDGLPLAVELAAAWVRVLSLGDIAGRLDDAPALLLVGHGGPLPGDQTMAATVDGSCALLAPTARRLFERLSVFVGGFDLPAAQTIADQERSVLSDLAHLVDHSLVVMDATLVPTRYRMLEPVRQCAAAGLVERGDEPTVRRLHAQHYLELARRCDPFGWGGYPKPLPLSRLEQEQGNHMAALRWARAAPDDRLALALAEAFGPLWLFHGRLDEGRRCLEELLAAGHDDDSQVRAAALVRAGLLAWRQGDYRAARRMGEDSLALCEQLDEPWWLALARNLLAYVALAEGDAATAERLTLENIAAFQSDKQSMSWTLVIHGFARYIGANAADGITSLHAALEAARDTENASAEMTALLGLSYGACLLGDTPAQRVHLTEAMTVLKARDPAFIPVDLVGCSLLLALRERRWHAAGRLAGALFQLAQHSGSSYPPQLNHLVVAGLKQLRGQVGVALGERLVEVGADMSLEQLIDEALAHPRDEASDRLSRREREVAELAATGLNNVEIARELHISRRTVESHLEHIRQKLDLSSRHQVIAWVLRSTQQGPSSE